MTDNQERIARAAELRDLRKTLNSIETAGDDKAFQAYAQVIHDSPNFQKEIAAMRRRVAELELIQALEEERGQALSMLDVIVPMLADAHASDASATCQSDADECSVCEALDTSRALLHLSQGKDDVDGRIFIAAPDALAALSRFINPTGHTDICVERREIGETKCSRQCAAARAALIKAGVELPDVFAQAPQTN